LTNPTFDPVAKIPEFKVCAVKIQKMDTSDKSISSPLLVFRWCFLTGLLPIFRFPALSLLPGHKPLHDISASPVGYSAKSGPISASIEQQMVRDIASFHGKKLNYWTGSN